ncbi:MAG: acetoin utilization protein AcuC [Actinomycetota bacterium]
MSGEALLVFDDGLTAYDFGRGHPMSPIRVELTIKLAREFGVLDQLKIVPAPTADDALLETVHTAEYVAAVKRAGEYPDDADPVHGLGTSDTYCFPRMHEVSAQIAGASVEAARAVWEGDVLHAANIAGGLHHAMPNQASGFCVYNDPAIAIRWLLEKGASRVAYVDVDVHHGDGVQAAFFDDPRVLTISLHESGRYLFPGTGFVDELGTGDAEGTKVNVALPPFTHDDAYRAAFERVVPRLVESFEPDVLVTQLGCDTHATDPLAHFALTTTTYRWLASMFHEMAHAHTGGRWLATGGGGYQIFAVVPRAWTIYFAELLHASLPDEVPAGWLARAREEGADELPVRFDDPAVIMPEARRAEVTAEAQRAADETMDRIFPYFGI